ncbi:MAG TPA: hypothetical protein V6D03_15215 [Candidatus Caenarcaniphilales bacterium]
MSHSVLKYTFKLRDPNRLNWMIETLSEKESAKLVGEMISQVIRELALEDPSTFLWALRTLISPESLLNLGEVSASRCAAHLTQKGFVAGRDYELHPEGGLMVINSEAMNALLFGLPATIQQAIKVS